MSRIPVECIAVMNSKEIKPLRVRYETNDGKQVVNVDKILVKDKKTVFPTMNRPKSTEYTFKCETVQGDTLKPFILVFNNQSCRWYICV